jgi:hypothetical protein
VPGGGDGASESRRDQDLEKVRQWFSPALQPDEHLRAALATTPFRLTVVNSLLGTAKDLIGQNQSRILLLTDRAVHVVGRRFWRRRFRSLLVTFPLGTVAIRYDSGELRLDDDKFYVNISGFQLGGDVGSTTDIELFVEAGATRRT